MDEMFGPQCETATDKYDRLEWPLTLLFAIYFVFMKVGEFIDIAKGDTVFLIFAVILCCFFSFLFANYPAKLIVLVVMLAAALFSVTKYVLSWIFKTMLSSSNSNTHLRCTVQCFLTEEEENIIGDLREEFSQFQSKPQAHVWLSKQILTSIPPLLYNNLKSRLAS